MDSRGNLPVPAVIFSIPPIAVAQPHPGESIGGCILVVDDDAIARAVLENRLAAHGHRVVCV
ncbi:MAG: hypothetical protein QG602_147 [Verrucomicrobiota bacterium]|nr:hypothetical protein [Verrucomicrobiota bacterium]